jgi:hypothetical protein
MPAAPKLFTCPKCHGTYLGHDPLPDCPHCGYDYREKEGFRWDVLVYFLSIIALMGFLLVSSYYRVGMGPMRPAPGSAPAASDDMPEKLPGGSRPAPFVSPYHEPGR